MADTIDASVTIAQRIRLDSESAYILSRPDTTFQIEAAVLDRDGDEIEYAPIEYTSIDTAVATVDTTGLVEVIAFGSTWISLRAGSESAQVHIDVLPAIKSFRVEPDSATIAGVGETASFRAIGKSAVGGGEERELAAEWASLDTTVAVVGDGGVKLNGSGLVTARGEGSTSIVASYLQGETLFSDTAYVLVKAIHRISIRPGQLTLGPPGSRAQLRVEAYDRADNLIPNVQARWSSADTTIATVDSDGAVLVIRFGTTTITAQVRRTT